MVQEGDQGSNATCLPHCILVGGVVGREIGQSARNLLGSRVAEHTGIHARAAWTAHE